VAGSTLVTKANTTNKTHIDGHDEMQPKVDSFNGSAARDLAIERLTSGVPLTGNRLEARSQNYQRPDNRAHRVPV
jgi:hypothetical protein